VEQKKTMSPAQGCGQCCCGDVSEGELLERLDTVIDQYKDVQGALIPVLQSAQNLFGYLPKKVLQHISSRLGLPYSQVTGVV
jgi:NADH:ubiquinone oxidoreductase subunit E